jgi:hypothetical protein
VATRRREIELSVERPAGPGAVARLTVRWDAGAGGEKPTSEELRAGLEELRADLDALLGAPLAAAPIARRDRELAELVETYRPRQTELVDLLVADGEISETEHTLLLAYLARTPPPPAGRAPRSGAAASEPRLPFADRPIAAAPIEAPAAGSTGRAVPELLRTYEITSLKQAGAVRARRQISFAEYMSLKRHFEATGSAPERPGDPRGPRSV